ncbi:MAG TPA: polyprenol phosphomannose-dependent alpha 1,6 mannosyltransferase MptB [Streptosporangiaceae bacterium]|nr:polyprenol phosphomannose-dependent alpha 1,6 mannosyltransferase MptB [Streptosporangiaceae bacterium]
MTSRRGAQTAAADGVTGQTRPRGHRPPPSWVQALTSAPVLFSARTGTGATAVSIVLTIIVAALGPSVMEPALPGRAGQPPWAFAAHPSPYLVIVLTGLAIIAGTFGLVVTMRAVRRGWQVPPRLFLTAGLLAAVLLVLLPPFGSSDHLSYAAYGRMLASGHNPYLSGPNVLARLGDPVARTVEAPWQASPSVYGVLATGGQALASLAGGTSVRLTVFVLSLLNLAGFAGTGLLLHRLAGGDRGRQLRAALLWTCNPLLLQVLVAGEHVDSQAIVFGVAAVAMFAVALRRAAGGGGARRWVPLAVAAGALAGLGFAVKLSMVLAAAGLLVACLLTGQGLPARAGLSRPRGPAAGLAAGLAAGFAAVTAAAVGIGGTASVRAAFSAGSYVSIGTPWRWLRSAIKVATGETTADNIVKILAALAVLGLAWLLLRRLPGPDRLVLAGGPVDATGLAARAALAFSLAWLTAGPYLLPWYYGLAWALLPLLPWSSIDWFVTAQTGALAIGYLPAREVAMPAGTGWLETVVRTAITPALLLITGIALVIALRSGRTSSRTVPVRNTP